MNAIAIGLDGSLRDPFGGADDIQAGLIRCVGDPAQRFQEDGLRVMRALRFTSCFGFAIEEETAKAVHQSRTMLDRVAAERINAELCKLLEGPGAADVIRNYPDIFCQFWPQLEPLVNMEQDNPWHCYDGWEHTIHAVNAVSEDIVLRLAVLLHDIGKPSCKTTGDDGVDHFRGHPAVSAKMADEMLRQLRFDTKTRERVVRLVELHDAEIPPREKTVRKWLGKLGQEVFFQLLEVKIADNKAQNPAMVQERIAELAEIGTMAESILAQGACLSLRDLGVNGRDVIAAGVSPGPTVGKVLNNLLERVIDGEVPNERDALIGLIPAIVDSSWG